MLRPNPRQSLLRGEPALTSGGFLKMKRLLIAASALTLFTGLALAQVHDWRDLERVHKHIAESIREMERARAANHYDMEGRGAKAEQLLRDAEKELHEAVEAARSHK
jgi:hypothetical protein